VPGLPALGVTRRRRVDFEAVRRDLAGRCFICELVSGNPDYAYKVVYEDDLAIAFLQRFQSLYGYVLVAPKGTGSRSSATSRSTSTSRFRRSSTAWGGR
jgi:hypothetical protein